MTKTKTPEQRAAKGAAWLDSKLPGWFNDINPRRLDMESGSQNSGNDCGCVCAQLDRAYNRANGGDNYGGWSYGFRRLAGIRDAFSARFFQRAENLGFYGPGEYAELTAAWKHEVRVRRMREVV